MSAFFPAHGLDGNPFHVRASRVAADHVRGDADPPGWHEWYDRKPSGGYRRLQPRPQRPHAERRHYRHERRDRSCGPPTQTVRYVPATVVREGVLCVFNTVSYAGGQLACLGTNLTPSRTHVMYTMYIHVYCIYRYTYTGAVYLPKPARGKSPPRIYRRRGALATGAGRRPTLLITCLCCPL